MKPQTIVRHSNLNLKGGRTFSIQKVINTTSETYIQKHQDILLMFCIKLFLMSHIWNVIWIVMFYVEVELQQQRLGERSRVESFCGPGPETLSLLDCISVPRQKLQDLQNNGRKFIQIHSSIHSVKRVLFDVKFCRWNQRHRALPVPQCQILQQILIENHNLVMN